tara:strand:+ start:745 stop:1515 length:771 start_codon:yes stop_codon:yes gene_type:complete
MQLVILAGGLGTRISEESILRPKPLIEIGGRPIIWHIMKHYSHYGINDFVICCGYKGYMIKEFFSNYLLHISDVTINLDKNQIQFHNSKKDSWTITLVDTGAETQTGGRLKRVEKYLKPEFCMTYGDGLSNVNIKKLINFHKKNKKLATMTTVQPPGRFGIVKTKGDKILNFLEKPVGNGAWINGGFFVLNKKILKLIKDDMTIWEKKPLEILAKKRELISFKHKDFWHPMDTLRDKHYLEDLWQKKNCPWKLWNE